MNREGSVQVRVTTEDGFVVIHFVTKDGENSPRGARIVSESVAAAHMTLKELLMSEVDWMVEQLFSTLDENPNALKLQCPFCEEEFMVEFEDMKAPKLMPCPIDFCSHTILLESFEEAL